MSTDPDPIKVREENEMQLVVTTRRQLSDSHTAARGADMQIGGPNDTKRKRDPEKTKARQKKQQSEHRKERLQEIHTKRRNSETKMSKKRQERECINDSSTINPKRKTVFDKHMQKGHQKTMNHRTGKQAIEKRKTKQKDRGRHKRHPGGRRDVKTVKYGPGC